MSNRKLLDHQLVVHQMIISLLHKSTPRVDQKQHD